MNQRSNTLQVVHELPGRLRLRWPADLTAEEQRGLRSMLLAEPWVAALRCSAASRSLVIDLVPGCGAVRWQIALAAMGWQLSDVTHTSPATAPAPSAPPTGGWDQVSRDVGGSMIGAVAGQVLLAGAAGTVGGLAGFAVGGMLGGQLGSDLTTAWKGVGKRRWFNSMVDDSAGEALSESLAARIGSLLGGNSPAARQIGASVGMRVGRKINWRASVEQRHLVNRLQVAN